MSGSASQTIADHPIVGEANLHPDAIVERLHEAALISFEIANLVSMSWLRLVPIAVVGSLSGPLLSLALATVAENKVQGFAVVKALGTLMTPAVVAYFIATPWQYIAGILPLYWPLKAFWLAHEGGAPWVPFLLVGLVYQLALLACLLRRFRRVLHR